MVPFELKFPRGSGMKGAYISHTVNNIVPPLHDGRDTYTVYFEGEVLGVGGSFYTSAITKGRETVARLTIDYDQRRGVVTSFSTHPQASSEEAERIAHDQGHRR